MAINVINSDNSYKLIKEGIKASNLRAQTIANNMANINTKGYKKFDVIFEENLKNTEEGTNLSLKTTDEVHLKDDLQTNDNISIHRVNTTSMRTDGNNVDLELEKVNQAANTLKYNALISRINNKFNNIRTVMK
ncbi:flagellar basal body rod protein FlgB [Clostridium weizhouense]|uniref:Flagellar basal body rod protein FlgB n=1 Tax=Clostridium weizhouense TaxID=2859781 RepID=A0ABS7AJH5_9CLOT|nr:flagellar basal body rod protein FlgB [Clostridium weizhouense]MBW6408566.1 flagellar basal body rod protein FlgB [Clostridium weizhouense]